MDDGEDASSPEKAQGEYYDLVANNGHFQNQNGISKPLEKVKVNHVLRSAEWRVKDESRADSAFWRGSDGLEAVCIDTYLKLEEALEQIDGKIASSAISTYLEDVCFSTTSSQPI
ncbi:hypothetical protein STEG23_022450 [Scotinomys teguina]